MHAILALLAGKEREIVDNLVGVARLRGDQNDRMLGALPGGREQKPFIDGANRREDAGVGGERGASGEPTLDGIRRIVYDLLQ